MYSMKGINVFTHMYLWCTCGDEVFGFCEGRKMTGKDDLMLTKSITATHVKDLTLEFSNC